MTFRIIARLDVKAPYLVKGVQLEGFKKIGSPIEFAHKYYYEGIDEICYQDIVASLYQRNNLASLLSETAKNVFVPITVGGGVYDEVQALNLIRSGADRISINTAVFSNPSLLRIIANKLGKQAVVLNIEAKKIERKWICMTNTGRDQTGEDVLSWLSKVDTSSIGEIILTSVDKDGVGNGFDLELLKLVRKNTQVSLLVHGGLSTIQQIVKVFELGAQGVLLASALHKNILSIKDIKSALLAKGVQVRT